MEVPGEVLLTLACSLVEVVELSVEEVGVDSLVEYLGLQAPSHGEQ